MPIVKHSAKEIREHGGRVDWKKIKSTTDEEIAAQSALDADTAPEVVDVSKFRRVYNPPVPDIKEIRQKLGLSQVAFARRFGFSLHSIQQWEQGRAVPDRSARILLKIIEHRPDAVTEALAG